MGALVELRWFRDRLDSALAGLAELDGPPAPRRGPRIGRGTPGKPVAQVRGVLVERVSVSIPLDPWLDLKALAGYSGLSVRNLRSRLKDPAHPLPSHKIGEATFFGDSTPAWLNICSKGNSRCAWTSLSTPSSR